MAWSKEELKRAHRDFAERSEALASKFSDEDAPFSQEGADSFLQAYNALQASCAEGSRNSLYASMCDQMSEASRRVFERGWEHLCKRLVASTMESLQFHKFAE